MWYPACEFVTSTTITSAVQSVVEHDYTQRFDDLVHIHDPTVYTQHIILYAVILSFSYFEAEHA